MGLTRRKYLSGNFAKKKMDIDMEKVYREIDAGKTIAQVADGETGEGVSAAEETSESG